MTRLYDTDFYIWTEEMAHRLRERDASALDRGEHRGGNREHG